MPVIACPNGKYRIGSGPCMYHSKEKAQKAYRAYLYYSNKEHFKNLSDRILSLRFVEAFQGIHFMDRYSALGIDPPSPETVCKGHCEGTGVIPIYMKEGDPRTSPKLARGPDEDDPELIRRWREAEKEEPSDDGYHFVTCPDCEGTGKKASEHFRICRDCEGWGHLVPDITSLHSPSRPYEGAPYRCEGCKGKGVVERENILDPETQLRCRCGWTGQKKDLADNYMCPNCHDDDILSINGETVEHLSPCPACDGTGDNIRPLDGDADCEDDKDYCTRCGGTGMEDKLFPEKKIRTRYGKAHPDAGGGATSGPAGASLNTLGMVPMGNILRPGLGARKRSARLQRIKSILQK